MQLEVEAISTKRDNCLICPKTIKLLRDLATNDPDEHLQKWTQSYLKKRENVNDLDAIA